MGGIDPRKQQKQAAVVEQPKEMKRPGFAKDGVIDFTRPKPSFKKSEHVGNKSDFPELGDERP